MIISTDYDFRVFYNDFYQHVQRLESEVQSMGTIVSTLGQGFLRMLTRVLRTVYGACTTLKTRVKVG
jgi:hypothetical protein